MPVGSKFKLGRHKLSGVLWIWEGHPQILCGYDYIFFQIKRALFILFKTGGVGYLHGWVDWTDRCMCSALTSSQGISVVALVCRETFAKKT